MKTILTEGRHNKANCLIVVAVAQEYIAAARHLMAPKKGKVGSLGGNIATGGRFRSSPMRTLAPRRSVTVAVGFAGTAR